MIRKFALYLSFLLTIHCTFLGQDVIIRPSQSGNNRVNNSHKQSNPKEKEEKFFLDNRNKPGVRETASGLQYIVKKQGAGRFPEITDSVKFHFVSKLIDGSEVASSISRGEPVKNKVSNLSEALTECIQLMQEESTYTFYIPSSRAFSIHGYGNIPRNIPLIVDVILLKVDDTMSNSASTTVVPLSTSKSNGFNKIYDVVDVQAQFPGGEKEMLKWLDKNIQWPRDSNGRKLHGDVEVKFVIECDGKISNVKVANSNNENLNSSAIDVISSMPRWTPAQVKGQPVRTQMGIDLYF